MAAESQTSGPWTSLLLVRSVGDAQRSRILSDIDSIFQFKMLPLISLKTGHPWARNPPPGMQKLEFTETTYSVVWAINRALIEASRSVRTWAPNGNRWVMGLDWAPPYLTVQPNDPRKIQENIIVEWLRIAWPAAIGLSLQFKLSTKLDDVHPVSIATRIAAQYLPIVVAAGNWGRLGSGTLSPLARLPWTIAVGASEDPEGARLHPVSSTGNPETESETGVTLVAHGENMFRPGHYGTSFAVPRVVEYLLFTTAFFLQIQSVFETHRTGKRGGVPVLSRISVDSGFDEFDPKPAVPLPMIPHVGLDFKVVEDVVRTISKFHPDVSFEPFPNIIRTMLIASATSMPGYQPYQVGNGFISKRSTINYLSRFDALQLAELVLGSDQIDDTLRSKFADRILSKPDELEALYEFARLSSLILSIDYRTGKVFRSMRPPTNNQGYYLQKNRHGWPPPL